MSSLFNDRVAEALGWKYGPSSARCAHEGHHSDFTKRPQVDTGWTSPEGRFICDGKHCESEDCYEGLCPPDFEHDWSAIGPLIEKHEIHLEPFYHWTKNRENEWVRVTSWCASTHRPNLDWKDDLAANGSTPILAVCNLILALVEAGKLIQTT